MPGQSDLIVGEITDIHAPGNVAQSMERRRDTRNSDRRSRGSSRSKSRSRKTRVSSSSSGTSSQVAQTRPPRSTRRVAAAEKKWGQSSLPSTAPGDLEDAEKRTKAEEAGHSLPKTPSASTHGSRFKQRTISGAKTKHATASQRRQEYHKGQNEIPSKELSDIMRTEATDDLLEDDDILSDEDDNLLKQPQSSISLSDRIDGTDDCVIPRATVSSKARTNVSSRRPRRTNDDSAPSANSSRRSRRARGLDDDKEQDEGSRSRSKNARSSRKGRSSSAKRRTHDRSALPLSTRNSQVRSTHQHKSRNGTSEDDDDHSACSQKSVGRRRSMRGSTSRSTPIPTSNGPNDDEQSTSSKKSSRRRRAQKQQNRCKSTTSSQKHDTLQPASIFPDEIVMDLTNDTREAYSLAKHIEAESNGKVNPDDQDQSEESSRYTANCQHPSSLLQFDPTNANRFTLVKQESKAVVTSDTFKSTNGTESELRIRAFKVKTLPSFEKVATDLNESSTSLGSDSRPHSVHSVRSLTFNEDVEDNKQNNKSLSNLAFMITPNRRRRGVNQSGLRGRGVSKAKSTGGLRRTFGPRKERDPSRPAPPGPSNSFHNSVKGFIGRWNKPGDGENDKSNEHCVLDDDYCSD